MHPRAKKLVFVIQDLKTKEGETVAIVSGDIHLMTTDKKKTISFQMLLADNKAFQRAIKDLVAEAIHLNDKKKY
jgi:hypothetical protein